MFQEPQEQQGLVFNFPVDRQIFEDCSWPQIKEIIAHERQSYNVQCSYRFIVTKRKYLYVRCAKCRSQLKFRIREDNTLNLMSFNNNHNHRSISQKQQNLRQIRNFINELPTTVQASSAKKIVMNKFGIKESKFYYLFNQIRNPSQNLKQTLQRLLKQGYQIVTQPFEFKQNDEPDFILAVSPLMKQNFLRYGQWTSLDFTYNMITQKQRGGKKYAVGCFVGLNNCKNILPFAFVITSSQTKQFYYSIFKSFFDIMETAPQTLITDEAQSIKGAIKQLTNDGFFTGFHLLDCFHILKNAKKYLKDKSLLTQLKYLVHARTKQQYKEKLQKCYELAEDQDVDVITKFDKNREMYCFSCAPETMFGFSISDSINQKINDMMKNVVPRSRSLQFVMNKILKFLQELGAKEQDLKIEKIKIEKIFGYPNIKDIRCSLHEKVFSEFTKELGKVHLLEIMHIERQLIIIINSQKHEFTLKKEQIWMCNCNYRTKTGLPCSHQIKVCLYLKLQFTDYIHQRWLLHKKDLIVKSRPKSRKTRRNLLK